MAEIEEIIPDYKHAAESDDIIWGLDMPRITWYGIVIFTVLVNCLFVLYTYRCICYRKQQQGKVKKSE